MWIPSHTGNTGIEEVDLLANQAVSFSEPIEIKSLSYKDLLRIDIIIALQQWKF